MFLLAARRMGVAPGLCLVFEDAEPGIVGARAALVHAIDAEAAAFYRHFGFEPSPANDLHLMLLMKDLRMGLRL